MRGETTHTPGPWVHVDGYPDTPEYAGYVVAAEILTLAFVTVPDTLTKREGEGRANLRLIAAAPDLLAALRGMCCPLSDPKCDKSANARAAIAKATLSSSKTGKQREE